MAALNRRTFGRPGPTNVIAFPVDVAGKEGDQEPTPSPAPPLPAPGGPLPASLSSEGAEGCRPPDRRRPPACPAPPIILGEVVISMETTARQAQESGWPVEELFDFYLIHGILHLLGYHHRTPQEEAAMEAKSWELLDMLHGKEDRGEDLRT